MGGCFSDVGNWILADKNIGFAASNLWFLIFSPLPPEQLIQLIYEASGEDISIAVLTQVIQKAA